jgi:hypothetical protein
MQWCPFCGWMPKGGYHIWTKHSMQFYKAEPDSPEPVPTTNFS